MRDVARRRRAIFLAPVVILALCLALYLRAKRSGVIDDSSIVGVWRESPSRSSAGIASNRPNGYWTIELRGNHTYVWGPAFEKGTWRRQGRDLFLTPESGKSFLLTLEQLAQPTRTVRSLPFKIVSTREIDWAPESLNTNGRWWMAFTR
ncbi:MAG: hypothetical protein ACYC96_12830 [Fimbriimonadaceae bacterium]